MTDRYELSVQDSFPLSSSSEQYGDQYGYEDCDDLSDELLYSKPPDTVEETQSFTIRDSLLLDDGLEESVPEQSVTAEAKVDKRPDILKVGMSWRESANLVNY